MTRTIREHDKTFIGTTEGDQCVEGYVNDKCENLQESLEQADEINSHEGDDLICTGAGDDLTAGDIGGAKWTSVDGNYIRQLPCTPVSQRFFDCVSRLMSIADIWSAETKSAASKPRSLVPQRWTFLTKEERPNAPLLG